MARSSRSSRSGVVALLALLSCGVFPVAAEQPVSKKDSIHDFVENEVKKDGEDTSLTSYAAAAIPETDMTVVYLSGEGYCGSGGCTLLILKEQGNSFKLVNSVTISWPPIVALRTKSHGAPDLGVTVAGGGIMPSYVAALPFDGKKYAKNPTVGPAYKVTDKTGTVLIRSMDELVPVAK